MKKFVLACTMMTVVAAAQAAEQKKSQMPEGAYWGVDLALIDVADFDLKALQGKAGMKLQDHVYAEGRFALGIDDDTKTIDTGFGSTVKAKAELDFYFGGYIKGELPINNDKVHPYGFAGLTYIDGAGDDDIELSLGLGSTFDIQDNLGLGLEFFRISDDVDAIMLGVTGKF